MITLHRPCGLSIILWPCGSVDVLPTPQAIELAAHYELCMFAQESRASCL